MSRTTILAIGALLWGVFAVDSIIHVANGDWIAPAIAGFVGAVWVAVRLVQRSLVQAA
jgi:hypothetical protein